MNENRVMSIAQPWINFGNNAKLYETQPNDPNELIRLWQERRWIGRA